jgi:peptidoglycan-associated lipoprotein
MRRTVIRLWVGTAVAAMVVGLAGCPPAYPKCENDSQCKEHGEYCVQGQCQQCAVDGNCPANFVCQANKCVPKPECTKDVQCGDKKKCEAGKCVTDPNAEKPPDTSSGSDANQPKYDSVSDCHLPPVRFGFNDTVLTAEARQTLNGALECLKSVSAKQKIVLEGHADERGTEEYNLQLSNRRAAAVKKYLADLGVASGKLDTVGYGENKPAVDGHDEAAWAANRRVEFGGK